MSKRMDRRILDTNAMVMGGGVGLAALEAMFNLVQTQSVLASSLVRHHDMSHHIALHTMAASINEIMETGYGADNGGGGGRGVRVNIPRPQPQSHSQASGGSDGGDGSVERGAISGVDELANMFKSNASASATTPSTADPQYAGINMDQHLTELLELLREHLSEILKSSKPTMMVT